MKVSGSRPLWIALASLALTPLSWSASADEAGFSATANRTCRQIIETRPDGVLDKGRKAGVEVILAGRAGAELSRDARHALRNDLAASRDELRRSVRALEGFAAPDGQQEDWNIFTAFLEAEMARQDIHSTDRASDRPQPEARPGRLAGTASRCVPHTAQLSG